LQLLRDRCYISTDDCFLFCFDRLYLQHGGGVRCKLAGCNRVAIGKVQLCRAHGGGARPKQDTLDSFSGGQVRLPFSSTLDSEGTFCVPVIEPGMDVYDGQQQQQGFGGSDFVNI
jgi:hypothetical protein